MPKFLADHEYRVRLANELHARPFTLLEAPFRLSHVAVSSGAGSAERARAHLKELCDRFGAPHPSSNQPQFLLDLGRFRLKWEQHTEFIALSVIAGPGAPEHRPFADPAIELLPQDWLEGMDGDVIAAIHVHAEEVEELGPPGMPAHLAPHFSAQSLVGGSVFDDQARFWGDFRIHEDGFMRFAVRCERTFEGALLGRLAQRLVEVETYRAMSMMALPGSRGIWPELNQIDAALAEVTSGIGASSTQTERALLDRITELSAELEQITSRTAFRLDASRAYSAIVWRRIEVLSSTPLPGQIDLKAFMMRRYDPAMRSCEATRARLTTLAERAGRVATLLRTRIDVALEEQNRALLDAMNRRSAQQLRLQETVEGLSVVAISYYAVSLIALIVVPFAKGIGIGESWAKALVALPVILLVWMFVRRVKAHAMKAAESDPGA